MKRVLFIAFSLEVGLLLLVVPWSAYWDRNYFAQELPVLRAIVTNNFVRGGVSGLGLVNLFVGLVELGSMLAARRPEDPPRFRSPEVTAEK